MPGQRGSSGREGNVPLPTPPRVKLWKSEPGCRSVAGGRPAQVPKEMRQHSKLRLGQRRRARAGEAQWLPGPLSHSHGKRHRPSDEIWSLQLPSMTDSVGCFLNIRTHCSGKEPLFLMLGGACTHVFSVETFSYTGEHRTLPSPPTQESKTVPAYHNPPALCWSRLCRRRTHEGALLSLCSQSHNDAESTPLMLSPPCIWVLFSMKPSSPVDNQMHTQLASSMPFMPETPAWHLDI